MNLPELFTQLLAFIQQNQQLLIVGIAVYLFATGRIDVSKLISFLSPKKPEPAPEPPPVVVPAPQVPDFIKVLIDLLVKARADGAKGTEEAVVKALEQSKE